MYKIGEFSKMVDIPTRTLRYYADCGVLEPSHVDPLTGYKYYSEEDITECEFIKLLKSLDFTLDEIKKYRYEMHEDILEKKKREFEIRIYLLRLKYEKLNCMQRELNEKKAYLQFTRKEKEMYGKRNIRKISK